MHYGKCLLKLGYAPELWRDESSAELIITTWAGDCPFASAAELIAACEAVWPEVEAAELALAKAEAYSELDPLTLQYNRRLALGLDTTIILQRLREAQAAIEARFTD